ncbi:MAG: class I SAM-dependent methyltransferase [Planctomycetaceae bacterium]|nr:class I SAM-dependent methyltransferase [Planctomycetaceae bacterium]
MWNERYSGDEYAYGTEPNTFLAEHAHMLEGPVLSLAEGEGRNAVYLATLGLSVLGVDSSDVGLAKAQQLAKARNVEIETEVADLATFEPRANHYGAVISIWAHMPSLMRARLCPLIEQCLKPGGLVLLEAYSENQLHYGTGGPKDRDMLMTCEKIVQAFPNLETVLLTETEREIHEGKYHKGLSSVIQYIGQKSISSPQR